MRGKVNTETASNEINRTEAESRPAPAAVSERKTVQAIPELCRNYKSLWFLQDDLCNTTKIIL